MMKDFQILAMVWAVVGWFVKVIWDYYTHATALQNGKVKKKFKFIVMLRKYDQSWIMGFVGALALGAIADLAYPLLASKIIVLWGGEQENVPTYDVRINMLVGFSAIWLISKFTKKIHND